MSANLGLRPALTALLAIGLAGAAVAGCGGLAPAREEEESARSSGAEREQSVAEGAGGGGLSADSEMPAAVTSATGTAAAMGRSSSSIVAVPRPEPSPWHAHEWMIAPAMPQRVMLATVELPPGDAFRPPTTSCQDVILFVREGQLEATGTGIASSDAPITLYPGDAARFGPEGDGVAVNVGATRARTVMAIARRQGTGPARAPAPHDDACAIAAAHPDPLRRPLRVASIATTPALVTAGGLLEVRILLDEDGAGASHGALAWLEGAPDLALAEHMHPGSAEVLLIEEGEGTMRVGDREIAIAPGSAIYVPEGTLHSFRGAGTRPLRAIQIYGPGGPEQRSGAR